MMYNKMNHGENLGWCKPYVSDDGSCFVIVNSGKIASCIINGEDVGYILPSTDVNAIAHRLAVAVNADYSDWDALRREA